MLLSLRCFMSDLKALPSPAEGSVCAALLLCAMDKATADACAALCCNQSTHVNPACTFVVIEPACYTVLLFQLCHATSRPSQVYDIINAHTVIGLSDASGRQHA